nr:NADH dehydrogenase subunit 4 [Goniodes ortygis]
MMVFWMLSIFLVMWMTYPGGMYSMSMMMIDEVSFLLSVLSILLFICVSVVSMCSNPSNLKSKIIYSSVIFSIGFFLVKNLLLFFLLFEMSIIPVFVLILMYGTQPERLKASLYMLMFTFISSSPLLMIIIIWIFNQGTYSLFYFSQSIPMSEMFVVFLFVAFLVKSPIYLFHSWLPKAHVEAPIEGSMILAGLMLKVGIFGIIRMMNLLNYMSGKVSDLIFSVSLVGGVMSFIIALSSDDLKMRVAFSSISHMNMCLASIMVGKILSLESGVLVMMAHGLSSPLLFLIVTMVYNYSGSRSLILSKGSMINFPLFNFMSFIGWSLNICAPPSLSFMGELGMISSIISFYWVSMIFIMVYMIIGSFFSIITYSAPIHSSSSSLKKSCSLMYFYLFSTLSSVMIIISMMTMDMIQFS